MYNKYILLTTLKGTYSRLHCFIFFDRHYTQIKPHKSKIEKKKSSPKTTHWIDCLGVRDSKTEERQQIYLDMKWNKKKKQHKFMSHTVKHQSF